MTMYSNIQSVFFFFYTVGNKVGDRIHTIYANYIFNQQTKAFLTCLTLLKQININNIHFIKNILSLTFWGFYDFHAK